MKLYYAGKPGQGYGWGVANTYLIQELSRLGEVISPVPEGQVDGDVFMPLGDHGFNPISTCRGKRNFGYAFFEYPLQPEARENAKKYDLIFVGSTWCKERCAEFGIHNTEVLIQGVDFEIFWPMPNLAPDEFTIFSGGKFEYRKGQDVVLAAFKEFSKTNPEARLVAAWDNPWPALIGTMAKSPYIKLPTVFYGWPRFWSELCELNGLPKERITFLPSLDQQGLARWMNKTSVGLFPNRCEGGTNLVLMEYLACEKPCLATRQTGHRDLEFPNSVPSLIGKDGWAEPAVDCIVGSLERMKAFPHAFPYFPGISDFTWSRAAKQIASHLN